MVTVIDIIHARSKFRIGPDSSCDRTLSEFTTLETLATLRLSKIAGSRTFSANETAEMKALIVLDMLQNEHGKGTIIQESMKDDSWKSNVKTSSQWMDELYQRISEYDQDIGFVLELDTSGVLRDDHYIPGISENHPPKLPHRYHREF
jgi:hypothetical protein